MDVPFAAVASASTFGNKYHGYVRHHCMQAAWQPALWELTMKCFPLVILLFVSTQCGNPENPLIGTWVCTDLSSYSHSEIFSSRKHIYGSDGILTCVVTRKSDNQTMPYFTVPYIVFGDLISYPPKPQTRECDSFVIDGDILKITTIKAAENKSMVGSEYFYHRIPDSRFPQQLFLWKCWLPSITLITAWCIYRAVAKCRRKPNKERMARRQKPHNHPTNSNQ